jgi:DNA invertase Pin-like site-specific DNA recombinase
MFCGIYIRKSREDKEKQAYRLNYQREALPAYAMRQGWQYTIYDDGHASAARGKIDQLEARGRLEGDIRAGKIQVVLVIELSRLSRDDTLQDYVSWLSMCAEFGVQLSTMSRALSPSEHSDWMLLLMEGGFSSVEMKVITARMAEGRREAFRQGKWLGGHAPPPYRYDRATRCLEVDPVKLTRMQLIWRMAETHSAKSIAETVNRAEITIRRMLSDQRLLLYQALRLDPETGEQIMCAWEPVMREEQAQRIRTARRRRKNTKETPSQSLLTGMGLLVCGYCGRTVKAWNNSKPRADGTRLNYYGCQSKNKKGECGKSRMIPQVILDGKVVSNLLTVFKQVEHYQHQWWQERQAGQLPADVSAIDIRLAELEAQRQRIVDAISMDAIELSDAKGKIAAIKVEIREVEEHRQTILTEIDEAREFEVIAVSREEFMEYSKESQRDLIRASIKEVKLFGTYALITYRFGKNAKGDRTTRLHLPPSARGKNRGAKPVYAVEK